MNQLNQPRMKVYIRVKPKQDGAMQNLHPTKLAEA